MNTDDNITPMITPVKKIQPSTDINNLNTNNNQSTYSKTAEGFGPVRRINIQCVNNKENSISVTTPRENMPLLTDTTGVSPRNNDSVTNFKKMLRRNKHPSAERLEQVTTESRLKARNSRKPSLPNKYLVRDSVKDEIKAANEGGFAEAIKRKTRTAVDMFANSGIKNEDIIEQEMKFCKELQEIEFQQEDEQETTILYENLDYVELSNAFFNFLCIISAIFSHDYQMKLDYYVNDPESEYSKYRDSLDRAHRTCLAICSISVLFFRKHSINHSLVIINTLRYIIRYQIDKSIKTLMTTDNFFNNKNFTYLLFENIIAIIHPNLAFIDYKFTTNGDWYLVSVPYHANDFLTFFTMFRIITVYRCFIVYTDFYNVRAYRVARLFGSELSVMFALRALYKSYPWRVVFCYAVTVTCLVAYSLRIIEGPVWYVLESSRDSLNDYRSYENCVWNTFVTFTTVGYGDYYALTNLGRLILIINSILGSVLVSLFAVTIQDFLAMNNEETKAVQQLERLADKLEINKVSARQVKATWDYLRAKGRLISAMKSNSNKKEVKVIQADLKNAVIRRIQAKNDLRLLIHKFRNVHSLPNEFDDIDNLIQSCEVLVENLNNKIDDSIYHYKKIKKYLKSSNNNNNSGEEDNSEPEGPAKEKISLKNQLSSKRKKLKPLNIKGSIGGISLFNTNNNNNSFTKSVQKKYHCPGCTCNNH